MILYNDGSMVKVLRINETHKVCRVHLESKKRSDGGKSGYDSVYRQIGE